MFSFTIDIEPTNRCNASCYFCPRDKTPHEGLLTQETFDQALARAVELREALPGDYKISLCGLGEPLINPKTPGFVRQVREAGFRCVMSSNGALLDERRGTALLEAGLQSINLNVGEKDEEYEDIYKLPFEKTRNNVVRFHEMAGDQCEVNMVVVDHRQDREHVKTMAKYWKSQGIGNFLYFNIMNRGGSLFVDHMQYEGFPELDEARALFAEKGTTPMCAAPFVFLFVGYDGQYYLCCSDWTKETPLGSVFDTDFLSVTRQKIEHVMTREPVCRSCNVDPVNHLAEMLRDVKTGHATQADLDALLIKLQTESQAAADVVAAIEQRVGAFPPVQLPEPKPGRRLIPVTSV